MVAGIKETAMSKTNQRKKEAPVFEQHSLNATDKKSSNKLNSNLDKGKVLLPVHQYQYKRQKH